MYELREQLMKIRDAIRDVEHSLNMIELEVTSLVEERKRWQDQQTPIEQPDEITS